PSPHYQFNRHLSLAHLLSYHLLSSLPSFPSPSLPFSFFFFFNDTATTEIYTLSLHDALPICMIYCFSGAAKMIVGAGSPCRGDRSEEHTSELQSLTNLVCRLLLEKKKKYNIQTVLESMPNKLCDIPFSHSRICHIMSHTTLPF